jgi:DNA primase
MKGRLMEHSSVDREVLPFVVVLGFYGTPCLSKKGEQLIAPCPIHKGSVRNKTFAINVRKNTFACSAKNCGATGDVFAFVAAMEHCSRSEAVTRINNWLASEKTEGDARQNDTFTEERPHVYRNLTARSSQGNSLRPRPVVTTST